MTKSGLRAVLPLGFILLLCVGITGSTKVDVSRIREHLNAYFKKVEQSKGVPVENQAAIIARYTDSRTMSKASGITLTQVVQVLVSLEEDSAVLTYGDRCQLKDQQELDMWLLGGIRLLDRERFRYTYDYHKKRAEAGKKYCNHGVYLRCQDDPMSPGNHVCGCPSRLLWETDKCVYSAEQNCHRIGAYGKYGETDKEFIFYEFEFDDFGTDSYPNCVKGTLCDKKFKCQKQENIEYYVSLPEIAAFLRGNLDNSNSKYPESEKIEIVKGAMNGIDLIFGRNDHARFVLSLEQQIQNRLLEHGSPCDPSQNAFAENHLKNYKRGGSSGWLNVGRNMEFVDADRVEFMLAVIKQGLPSKVCNRFKLFQCSSSNTCVCMNGLIFKKDTGVCTVKTGQPCGEAQQMKLFQVMKVEPEGHEDPKSLVLTFYSIVDLQCDEVDSTCESLNHYSRDRACVNKQKALMELWELQLKLENKFTIDINEDCNADAHEEFFKAESINYNPMNFISIQDFKKSIQALIDKPNQFCRIRQHATCSKDGKCTCVPPAVAEGTVCVFKKCLETSKSKHHRILDNLVLPNPNLMLRSSSRFYCTDTGIKCVYDQYYLERLCNCKTGADEWCEVGERSEHVGHLNMFTLPKDMKEHEGLKIIQELHTNMHQVEKAMKLKYGDPCDIGPNEDLKFIFDFLSGIREQCECKRSIRDGTTIWTCGTDLCSSKPEFAKGKFDELLKRTKSLASKSRYSKLCNWNAGIRCVSGTCDCPADYFYHERNGKARCGADLGVKCSPLTHFTEYGENDPLLASCRDGTQCTDYAGTGSEKGGSRCEMPKLPSSKICAGCSAEVYITKVKNTMNQQLTEELAALKKNTKPKSQDKGEPCNKGEQELEFLNKTLVNIGPIQEFATTTGSIQDERQKIRFISPTYEAILEMKVAYRVALYCKTGLICSPTSHSCELDPGMKPNPEDPNPKPPPLPPSSPGSATSGLVPRTSWFEFITLSALNILTIRNAVQIN